MTSPKRDSRPADATAADFPVIPVLLATDDLCDRFERAWKAGEPLTIESVVDSLDPRLIAENGEHARNLLSELIFLDVTYRRERGENPAPADYSSRFPRFAETIHELLSTLGERPRGRSAPPRTPARTDSAAPALPAAPADSANHQPASGPNNHPAAASAPAGAPSGPERIGEYQILKEIGRGGMGVVYRACQVGLGRDVALKMILAGELAGEEVVRRFQIEAAAAARLQHPHIVAIHAIGEERGRHYFSMELIDGASAAWRLRDGPFLPREAARITLTVARAVQYAHDHGVVHRDLKPANVLLDRDNTPHVTDFGIARLVASESTLTATAQGLGTPGFAAPEQLRGDRSAVSPAVDIYSLGATLYAFLTGHPPFQAATLVETARQVLDQEPVSPRLLNPAIPRDLETICLKCLSKSPAGRYATAADLADDLERALDGVPIRARPVSRAERAWRWCRRRPALASLAAVSGLSLLAAFLFGTAHFLQVESLNDRLRAANDRLQSAADEANQARTKAERNERAAMEMAYVGDIQRAAGAWRSQDYRNLEELLDRQVPKPGQPDLRGFEWGSLRSHLTVPARTLLARDKPLYCACLSPNERWIGVCGQEAIVWLFDALSLDLRQTIRTEQREVNGLAFTPDSRIVASAGDDGRVRFWEVETGAESRPPLQAHPEVAYQVAFNRGGTELIVCGNDPLIRRYQLDRNDSPLPPLDTAATVQAIQISPDGNLLVSVGNSGNPLVWDLRTGKYTVCTSPDQSICGALDIAWERGWLITGSNDHWLQTWNLTGGERTSALRGKVKIGSIALSPDRNRAVTGDEDGVLQFWEVANGRVPTASTDFARPHSDNICSVRWLPGGANVLSVSNDGRCIATPAFAVTRRSRRDFPELGELLALASLGAGDRYALCGRPQSLRIWNHRTRQFEQTLDERAWDDAVASPTAGILATRNHSSGLIALWDTSRAVKLSEFQYDTWVGGCALTPDGQSLAMIHSPIATDRDRRNDRISLVNSRTRQLVWTISGFHYPHLLVFSPDGRTLAFKSEVDIVLLDAANGKQIGTLPHQTEAYSAFNPDGTLLATGGTDRRVILWDIRQQQPRFVYLGHEDRIAQLAFSHDGRTLASADATGAIRLWSVPTGRELFVLDADSGRTPLALLFTDNDASLFSLGHGDFRLHAYESASGR